MKRRLFDLVVTASCISGCASVQAPRPHTKDWRDAKIHKILVVSVQRDPATNREIESYMAPTLRRQGFDVSTGQDLFPGASSYSARRLMDHMRQGGFDGIMELIYYDEVPKQGLPRQISFRYHSVKGRSVRLSDQSGPLDAALKELLAGLAR